jgi:ribosomal protein S18 acetylase RimI-like enzyme
VRIVDVTDEASFALVPPCADPAFDHRTCDYWEDADRGSKAARVAWLQAVSAERARPARPALPDNPFAPAPPKAAFNPFDPAATDDDENPFAAPPDNPFAPQETRERPRTAGVPRKLALLDRGRGIFGSYAKVLLVDDEPAGYSQFGPLSAYPRALRVRDLYPRLPQAPLPAVISCIATTPDARRQGHARALVEAVCEDLAGRGFAAVEAYPETGVPEDATPAAQPAFWEGLGFVMAAPDERYPVMRREL